MTSVKTINAAIVIAFVLLILSVKTSFANTDIINLAPNQSFEGGGINPENWQVRSSVYCNDGLVETSNNFSWTTNTFLSGAKSLSIEDISWTNSGNIPGIWISEPISLFPGKFEFSC